jgi:hypothetical protein
MTSYRVSKARVGLPDQIQWKVKYVFFKQKTQCYGTENISFGSGSDSGSKGPQKRFAAPATNKILKDTFFDLNASTFLHGFVHVIPK